MDTSIEGKFDGVGYTTRDDGTRVNYVVLKIGGANRVVAFLGELPADLVPGLVGKDAEFSEIRDGSKLAQSLNIGSRDSDHYFGSISLEVSRAENLLRYPIPLKTELFNRFNAA